MWAVCYRRALCSHPPTSDQKWRLLVFVLPLCPSLMLKVENSVRKNTVLLFTRAHDACVSRTSCHRMSVVSHCFLFLPPPFLCGLHNNGGDEGTRLPPPESLLESPPAPSGHFFDGLGDSAGFRPSRTTLTVVFKTQCEVRSSETSSNMAAVGKGEGRAADMKG